jgi:preprotein translocase subunit SecA
MPIEAVEPANTQEKSSRNALTHGLFAVRYFIREGEEEEYAETLTSVIADLAPQDIVEETFAAEIVGATWRLRRCRMVEHSLSAGAALDPMVDDLAEKKQISVDRARAQSHNILRRSLAELRKLQTERTLREQAAEQRKQNELDLMEALLEEINEDSIDENSFCKPAPQPVPQAPACEKPAEQTPRNAPCPCGSGTKYKRCCGKDAPPVLDLAA